MPEERGRRLAAIGNPFFPKMEHIQVL
jgi:hypothetical protein